MSSLDRLRRLVAAAASEGTHVTALPRVSVVSHAASSLPTGDRSEAALALVVGGAKRTVADGRSLTYGPGQYVVAAAAVPVTGTIVRASAERPFLAFVLHLDPTTIASMLLQAPAQADATPLGCPVAVGDASPGMLDAAARLLALLDRPRDAPVLAPLYERELLWELLVGQQGPLVRQIGLTDGRLARLGRAMGWIRIHYDEPLRVSELARLSAMSPRTLHRTFRAVTGMTPLQYQKWMRLHEARARLATGAAEIARVGHEVGYRSPSQFSREYRRLFGAPPGRDAQMRADPG